MVTESLARSTVESVPDSAGLLASMGTAEVGGLYVHVPFCRHKCHYCDFYSITRQTADRMERYVDLVLAEAGLWRNGGPPVRLLTVFFGGGTPTLLPAATMERLLEGLRKCFDFSAVEEWTVEANPATVDEAYCCLLRRIGVDRMSFGAQSFAEAELAVLERHHQSGDVPRSVAVARAAGFTRLNIDLIYAIPGQSLESYLHSLERSLAMKTGHLSCYGLTYEPNTALAVRRRLGQVKAAEPELELQMMHATRRQLAVAGLTAYEISNYAVAGQECRHNLMYWSGGDYVGLGPAAASHVRGTRWRNRPHLGEWEAAVGRGQIAATEVEVLSPMGRCGELVMLGLRLAEGVNYDEFAARSGYDARRLYRTELEQLSQLGLIQVDAGGFRLSERGLQVADSVAGEFLLPVRPS